MRIERLAIDGFGLHRDLHLDFAPGLNALVGPNEAGKSTLHAFVRAMLHGLPRGGPKHLPLAGGRHGGALTLSRAPERFRVERIFSPRKSLRVLDEAGANLGEGALEALLGNVDVSLHRSVFAFDLDDLRDLGLASDEIERRLFDAGLLGAGRSLASLRKELREAKEEVLRPRSGPIRELAKEVGELRRALAEEVANSRAHGERLQREEALAQAIEEAKRSRVTLRAAQRQWGILLALWPDEVERRRLRAIVAELPPAAERAAALEEALARHDALREREAARRASLERLEGEREELVAGLAALSIDERKLELEPELAALQQERRLQEESRQAMAALEASIAQKDELVAATLSSLGSGWDVQRALGVDRSLPRREALDALAAELARARQAWEGAERLAEEAERGLVAGRREAAFLAEGQAAFGALPDAGELEQRSKRLAELRAALWERAEAAAGEAEPALGRPMLGLGALALMAGAGLLVVDEPVGALAASLAALAFVGLGLLARRQRAGRPGAPRDHRSVALAAAARALGLPAEPKPAEVEGAALALDRARDRRQRWEELARRLAEQRDRVRLAEAAAEEARAAAAGRRDELDALLARWEAQTEDLGGDALSPDAARERLDRVDRAVGAWEGAQAERKERERLSRRIEGWAKRAFGLLAAAGIAPEARGAAALGPALADLGRALEQEREKAGRRAGWLERLEALDRSLQASRAEVEAAARERADCLRAVGAARREALVARLETARAREEAERGLERIERSFMERVGEGAGAEAIRRLLATGRRDAWEAEEGRSREALEALETRIEGLHGELAVLRREREAREASAAIPELAERLEERKAAWGERIAQYRRAALLEHLLDAALEELHEARQPAVLRSASAFFRVVTGERYLRIRQMREEQQVEVVTPSGASVPAASLSRGAREQLYLCLRLGLADAFAEQGTRLPLLMDDVLVNFDPDRARAMAQVLAHAAERHQILLFTCHPDTATLLEGEAGAHLVELPGHSLTLARSRASN